MPIEYKGGASSGGGGPVTVADGADVAQGTTTDSAWVSGAGTVVSLLKKIASAGGSAVSVADGSDVAQGATTDAAVTSDINGTLSAKLRGLVKIFASVWDSINGRLKVDGSGVTQPVSGTVTVQQGSGSNLHAVLDASGAVIGHVIIDSATIAAMTDGSQRVGGTVTTDVTDRSARLVGHVTVDNASIAVTGTFFQATQPVSAASMPLPSNAAIETGGNLAAAKADLDTIATNSATQATAAAQATANATLTAIAANTPALGQALMSASSPVVIASDQTTIYDRDQRRLNEMTFIETYDLTGAALSSRSYDRRSITDRRGSTGRGSSR